LKKILEKLIWNQNSKEFLTNPKLSIFQRIGTLDPLPPDLQFEERFLRSQFSVAMLYPFSAELDGVFIVKMDVPIKFHFASRFEIDVCKLSLNLIYAKTKHLNFLQQEVKYKKISEQLADKLLQSKIYAFNNKIVDTICFDLPNAFWHRKKHIISLPYVKDFSEKNSH
jgi:hypothetical protein